MEFTIRNGLDTPQVLRPLFEEYTHMLVEAEPAYAAYLGLQKYGAELEHPEIKYGAPWGRIYLAWAGEEVAGCIALRKIDEESCEIKRLYVRPAFRHMGLGRMLAERIVSDAREIGYHRVVLDTFPFLKTAIAMYRDMGFYDIASYNGNPMDNLLYLQLDL